MLRPSVDPAPASSERPPGPGDKGEKRERNAAATRARILDAGEREFAARGFAGARLREIAEAAGVQPALIHHYFTDKQGLYRAVLDRALLPTSNESWTLLESRRDLEGLLEGFIDLLLRFYAANRYLLSILRHEALSGSAVLDELTRERAGPIIEAVTRFLEERQRAGEVRADVPASEIVVASMSLVVYPFVEEGMLRALLPSSVVDGGPALERRKSAIVKLMLEGIRPPRAPKRHGGR